jgi:hypothetical protein
MITIARETLNELYLDYFNNYLTVECFADHNGLEVRHAEKLINIGREINNQGVNFQHTN